MKLLSSIFTFLTLILGLVQPVQAADSWQITNFHADLTIQAEGTVRVQETISVVFNQEKHGIFRDIPYAYRNAEGQTTYVTLNVQSVSVDGSSTPYDATHTDGYLHLKIGDPDVTITGAHTYVIDYMATGILLGYPSYDELYWNVTGDKWDVPIPKASATVILPQAGIVQTACYQGMVGSNTRCTDTQLGYKAEFAATNLSFDEGMTVALGYTKDMVPLLTGAAPGELIFDEEYVDAVTVSFLVTFALGCFGIIFLLRKIGIDEGKIIKVTMVEYEAPGGMRPGELGMLMKERMLPVHLSATIVDLAVRGYLAITEIPKTGIFGKADYMLERSNKSASELMEYEQVVMRTVFSPDSQVKVSDLKNSYYKSLPQVEKALYQEVMHKELFRKNPKQARNAVMGSGLGVLLGSLALLIFVGESLWPTVVGILVALCIVSVLLIIFSFVAPRRTALGRQLLQNAKGYKVFVSGTEKYRQPYFEKENVFMDVLPYAILFGVTDKLANAMKEMGISQTEPTWYVGAHPFNTYLFASAMSDFGSSLSSNMASTPSSSGSGGGGFSGGGFGGGGGGSW